MSVSGFIIGLVAGAGLIMSNYADYSLDISYSWFTCINISFAVFGLILGLAGAIKGANRPLGIAGLVLCVSVLIVSLFNIA